MWGPIGPSSARFFPFALFLSVLPAAGLLGLAAVLSSEPLFAQIALGDIEQGGQKQQAFQVRNESGVSVEVATIETSCLCASVRLERTRIHAGELLVGDVTLSMRAKLRFLGDLAIEAKGLTRNGKVAFVLLIRAHVCPAPQPMTSSL